MLSDFVNRHLYKLSLMIVFAWLVTTSFIDFIAVPTIFRTVTNSSEAGDVGMTIFSTYNKIEVFFSFSFLLFSFLIFRNLSQKRKILKASFLSIPVLLLGISLFYLIYLTPKITNLTFQKKVVLKSSPEYSQIEKTHGVYHQMYVKIDGVKLVLLLGIFLLHFNEEMIPEYKKLEGEK